MPSSAAAGQPCHDGAGGGAAAEESSVAVGPAAAAAAGAAAGEAWGSEASRAASAGREGGAGQEAAEGKDAALGARGLGREALGAQYLCLNQLDYAITALPIGTVLALCPLYLNQEMHMDIQLIGLAMMTGEFGGILCMKYAERGSGFLVRRPHDTNLILLMVATCLVLVPAWPKGWWYMSAIFMMLVQSFNSASKPVVGEALHRISVLLDVSPSKAFARANQWRRIGNAAMAGTSVFVYAVDPRLMFFIVGPPCFIFAAVHQIFLWKVDLISSMHHGAGRGRGSVITQLQAMPTSKIGELDAAVADTPAEGAPASVPRVLPERLLQFLIVHAFSFLDGMLSRLPFAFMSLAIVAQTGSRVLACGVLVAYQLARVLSQSFQTNVNGHAINYALTSVAVLGYICCIAMLTTGRGGDLWYVPVVFTGLAETLPVQQFYLNQLVGIQGPEGPGSEQSPQALRLRHLVMQSHTGTGAGSASAFICGSLQYKRIGLRGVALLGLGVALVKVGTCFAVHLGMRKRGSTMALHPSTGGPSAEATPPPAGANQLPSLLIVEDAGAKGPEDSLVAGAGAAGEAPVDSGPASEFSI